VTEACRKKANALRIKTADVYDQIYEMKLLELTKGQNTRANTALMEANRTPAERKAQAEEVRQFQIRLSRVTSAEQHPDWASHASETFRTRKL
jgi:hypothetical protein